MKKNLPFLLSNINNFLGLVNVEAIIFRAVDILYQVEFEAIETLGFILRVSD